MVVFAVICGLGAMGYCLWHVLTQREEPSLWDWVSSSFGGDSSDDD